MSELTLRALRAPSAVESLARTRAVVQQIRRPWQALAQGHGMPCPCGLYAWCPPLGSLWRFRVSYVYERKNTEERCGVAIEVG